MDSRLAVSMVAVAVSLGLAACDPSPDPEGSASDSESSSTGEAPIDHCETTIESDLPGASIEIDSPCSHSIAEAQDGVTTTYTIAIEEALPGVDSGNMCYETPTGGLHVEWFVRSDSMTHCHCDVGLCPDYTPSPTDLVTGETTGSFEWFAYQWSGPSDYDPPFGDAFPPGTYTIEVVATGFWDDGTNSQTPFTVRATRPVVLQ